MISWYTHRCWKSFLSMSTNIVFEIDDDDIIFIIIFLIFESNWKNVASLKIFDFWRSRIFDFLNENLFDFCEKKICSSSKVSRKSFINRFKIVRNKYYFQNSINNHLKNIRIWRRIVDRKFITNTQRLVFVNFRYLKMIEFCFEIS